MACSAPNKGEWPEPIVTKEGAKRPDAECPKIRAKAATGKTDKPRGVVRFNEPTHIL